MTKAASGDVPRRTMTDTTNAYCDTLRIPVPWVHRDEPRLYRLMKRAHELGCPVDEDEVQAASSEDPVPETPYWYTSPHIIRIRPHGPGRP
jgi:hypothetical protein